MPLGGVVLLEMNLLTIATAVLLATLTTSIHGLNTEKFLRDFGHLKAHPNGAPQSLTDLTKGLLSYQKAMGLTQTGKLDEETLKEMSYPRCGQKDVEDIKERRKRRYATNGGRYRWRRNHLTYRTLIYTSDLPRQTVDSEIARAFKVWSDVTPLTFTKLSSGRVDIEILFVSGVHSNKDYDPAFDGQSGVLAHAFYPENGDVHFDAAETWTIESYSGINLFQVAAHEIGHSLGLGHSNVQDALMYASYHGYRRGFQLHWDDIAGIRSLYGANQATRRPSTQPTTKPPPATRSSAPSPTNVCSLRKFDAITTVHGGGTYFFAGQYFFQYKAGNPTASRQAHLISSRWRHVTGPIGAALTRGYYTALFQHHPRAGFHGYHLFVGENRKDNLFRKTTHFLPGLPANMDATWVWGSKLKIYASKGARYWRYNQGNRRQDATYPRDIISWWEGAPQRIDSAFTDSINRLHFVKGTTAYRFDNRADQVVAQLDLLGQYFGCPGRSQSQIVQETVVSRNHHHEEDDDESESIEGEDILGNNPVSMENAVDLLSSGGRPLTSCFIGIYSAILLALFVVC